MVEYIEREALMRRIKEIHCAECDSYHGVRCRACWVDDTLDYIDRESAADVAPVRHGVWIKESDGGTRCSVCNKRVRYVTGGWYEPVDLSDMPYCPKCGAKMDGGAEDASV